MTRTIFAAALALAAVLLAIPAQATLLTRTFVSSTGSNSNPCTITQPCASFATAYALTAPNGIIAALDPGKYGPLTIIGPVAINGYGWASITGPASGNAIIINANASNGDVVTLTGLEIDGANAANNGIQFNSGGTLHIRNSVIQNFMGNGINFAPNGSSSQLYVSNTVVSDNTLYGIIVAPTGLGTTKGLIDNVKSEHNGQDGLNFNSSTQNMKITISDSVSVGNSGFGISAAGGGNARVTVIVRNSTVDNNGSEGLAAQQAGTAIIVTRSTVSANSAAYSASLNGVIVTYGDNNLFNNDNATGAPTTLTYE